MEKSAIHKSLLHTVEVFAGAVIVVFALYLFREPLNELLLHVIRNAEVRSLFIGLIGAGLTAGTGYIFKWVRSSEDVPVKDYVNE